MAKVFEQYRKTFIGTQCVIGAITAAALFQTRHAFAAGAFFLVMQVGAFAGAAWAASLKDRIGSVRRTRALRA
jgi:hypothetical protein